MQMYIILKNTNNNHRCAIEAYISSFVKQTNLHFVQKKQKNEKNNNITSDLTTSSPQVWQILKVYVEATSV